MSTFAPNLDIEVFLYGISKQIQPRRCGGKVVQVLGGW